MKLSREKVTFSICVVRNFSTRLWSFIRCIRSPISLVSKKDMGSFSSLIKKSDTREILIRMLIWQYPSADKIHTGAAYGQYELSQQDQVNDSQVLMGNTYIYDGLCKKRENKL